MADLRVDGQITLFPDCLQLMLGRERERERQIERERVGRRMGKGQGFEGRVREGKRK